MNKRITLLLVLLLVSTLIVALPTAAQENDLATCDEDIDTETDQNCDEEKQEEIASNGCTPGYWKNHEEVWEPWNDMEIGELFGSTEYFADMTLLDGLSLQGGSDLEGATEILLRAAIGAFLNTMYVDYPVETQGALNAMVNEALASGDRETMLTLADELDDYNNGECELGKSDIVINNDNENDGNIEGGIGEPGEAQVTICHIPPGNPSNAREITIGESAVQAHMDHGDAYTCDNVGTGDGGNGGKPENKGKPDTPGKSGK